MGWMVFDDYQKLVFHKTSSTSNICQINSKYETADTADSCLIAGSYYKNLCLLEGKLYITEFILKNG